MNENDDTPDEDFDAKVEGQTHDVYECADCGWQGFALVLNLRKGTICADCRSPNVKLFVKAPTTQEKAAMRAQHQGDKAAHLDEIDPEWRTRWHGDVDLAWGFYYGG